MKKIIIAMLVILIYCTACGQESNVYEDNRIVENDIDQELFVVKEVIGATSILVDKETGVNYLYTKKASGSLGYATMCPRYDTDGQLIIDKMK